MTADANQEANTSVTSPTNQEKKSVVAKESTPEERVLYTTRRGRVYESKDHYNISYDLPGVKEEDVQVRLDGDRLYLTAERKRSNQQTVAKYSEAFVLDRSLMDTQNVNTKLEDGVLSITFSKKEEAKPFSVPVQVVEPPTTEDASDSTSSTSHGLYLSIDVPGVKPSDAKVEVHRNQVSVQCERKRQRSGASKILRQYAVDPSSVDLKHLQAYLMDGVLTLVAPALSPEPARTLTLGGAAVVAAAPEGAEVAAPEKAKEAPQASSKVDDADKKEYEVVVETADDE